MMNSSPSGPIKDKFALLYNILQRDNAQRAIVFGGNYYAMPPSSCWLVWDKDNTGDFADCELAWTNLHKAVRRLKWRWNGMLQENGGRFKERRFHPTQKPVPVMRWCITHLGLPPGSTILDPFCGSGSTGVAALQEGMNFIGIEKEAKYVEIARRRIGAEAAQGKLGFA
jgi:DNA modification methylase